MPASESARPGDDREPLFWRAIPLRQPPWPRALFVTATALLVAAGLRLAMLGFPAGWGVSSTFFPTFIVATLFAGPGWGWGSLAVALAIGVSSLWSPLATPSQPGTLILFALSGALTVTVAGGLRTALVRLRREAVARGEAEAMLHLAQEAGGLGLWDWDLNAGKTRWSPGVFHNLGIPPRADPPGQQDLPDRVPPDTVDRPRPANPEADPGRAEVVGGRDELGAHLGRVFLLPAAAQPGVGLGGVHVEAVAVRGQEADLVAAFGPGPGGAVIAFDDPQLDGHGGPSQGRGQPA